MHVAEQVARTLITTGGIGTILAVSLLFVYLASVVVPLFSGTKIRPAGRAAIPATWTDDAWLAAGVDDYARLAWVLDRHGRLAVFRTETGELMLERALLGRAPSSAVAGAASTGFGFGFEDGSVVLGEVRCVTSFLQEDEIDDELRALEVGALLTLDSALVERFSRDQWRRTAIEVEVDAPMVVTEGAAIQRFDFLRSGTSATIAAYGADGRMWLVDVDSFENLFTGEVEHEVRRHDLPIDEELRGAPEHLLLNGSCTALFLAHDDGRLQRYDLRDRSDVRLVETVDLVVEPDASLTALSLLNGRTTLLVGTSSGSLDAWFVGIDEEVGDVGLLRAHAFAGAGNALRHIVSSPRSRLALVGYDDGSARLVQVTTDKVLAELPASGEGPSLALALAPREDRILAFGPDSVRSFELRLGHHEATLATLFTPVWYEGYARPEHAWQSTSGADEFEPKLGLWPLVFGTLKATFYSMLFGVPLALLAAVFTSEFLNRRLRAPIQSAIELMASLPSVVLGFIAALVIAPWVQGGLMSVVCAIFTIPLAFLLGAHLYQLLPGPLALRLAGWPRFVALILALFPGLWSASWIGPVVERGLFGGDLEGWLDGQGTSAFGGFFVFLVPFGCLLAVVAGRRIVDPILQRHQHEWSPTRLGLASLARFFCVTLAGLSVAALAALVLARSGADPRGGAWGVGTYVQRNALVVGFVMGFAIVPIVYTLAVDALSSVPGHLREASYASGATHWQTAVRVVVPTAASGIYSACMIGLGRAVGETMIVLMATGSTAILEWNPFNGFRTLSANLATELPEAVEGSTHYRTLFLAALLLFGMTFALNTIAELVRQRSRARFSQL